MSERFDVVIVGAGAAGLMAAIFARRTGRAMGTELRVAALDGAPRIGAKILISGGGRCNVTHHAVSAADFNGGSPNVIARLLRTFTVEETVAFFRELGVVLKREETGKLFPVTDRARTVLEPLVSEAGDVRPAHRVVAIECRASRFLVRTTEQSFEASAVVVATGGRSVPKTGSDGGGYELARSLGHSVRDVMPALVPLLLPKSHWLLELSGLSAEAELMLSAPGGRLLRRERGSMLMTHFGLSGPLVLDMSRHWIASEGGSLHANFLPGTEFTDVESMLMARPAATVAGNLAGTLPDRLVTALIENAAGVPATKRSAALTREERRSIAHALTNLALPVIGDRGFDYAEVTAGGVPLDEVDPRTLESRRCPGLYLCGEILDVDGRIGGFNFQWAWVTGRLAGMSAASGSV